MEDTMNQLRLLAEPFPDKLIEQVPPRGEDYVPWIHWAQRALTQLGPYNWQVVQVIPPRDGKGEWAVVGRIIATVDGETIHVDGIGQGQDAKAAESDAFKRAWSKTGMGQHLWAGKSYWLAKSLDAHASELSRGGGEPVGGEADQDTPTQRGLLDD
jgi:hypothetical protein